MNNGNGGCPDQAGKRRYYAMQERQRHAVDRDSHQMAGPQDVDIRGLILAMPARAPFVQRYPSGRGSLPDDNRQSSLR